MKKQDRLFVPSKQEYIRGERPKVECILCAVVEKNPEVQQLDIFRGELFIVSVNLFPYNPGHLMIFPKRHIESIEPFTSEEIIELHHIQVKSLKILNENYRAQGYNIGYNLGSVSGASINHLHLHIVPRYRSEAGFIDIIGNARIIVEDPRDTVKKLRESFEK